MKYKIILVGAGQLGSRHLQGLVRCNLPLEIIVIDPNVESLNRAKSRWIEVAATGVVHSVEFKHNFDEIAGSIDLAIISTNAGGRAELIQRIAKHLEVAYWLIEKVLAQSETELDLISTVLGENTKAWVNTPRRVMAWHQALKQATPRRTPSACTVSGGDWGLACNTVHFLDFMMWWTGEKVVSINTAQLASQWHPAKRGAYWEVYGTLLAQFSGGSGLTLHCTSEAANFAMTLGTQNDQWSIRELDGVAVRSNGALLPGRMEFQSEMTGALAESILSKGNCNLPTLSESVTLHRPLLNSLLAHWNSTMPDHLTQVPIT